MNFTFHHKTTNWISWNMANRI